MLIIVYQEILSLICEILFTHATFNITVYDYLGGFIHLHILKVSYMEKKKLNLCPHNMMVLDRAITMTRCGIWLQRLGNAGCCI